MPDEGFDFAEYVECPACLMQERKALTQLARHDTICGAQRTIREKALLQFPLL
jgi:hypothetical protein